MILSHGRRWTGPSLIITVLLCGSCKSNERQPAETAPSEKEAPLQSRTPKIMNPQAPAEKIVPTAMPRVKREVLVGGCLATCEDPMESLKGFLQGALDKDLDTVRSHLNTARLKYNGHPLGDAWAAQFLRGELGKRRESIDKWLKDWANWVDHIIDPAERRLVDDAILVIERNQQYMLIQYHPPDRTPIPNGARTGPVWRLKLEPRGLEWLVTTIDERPTQPRLRPR